MARLWHWLWRPAVRWPALALVAVGLVIGLLGSGVVAASLAWTSTDSFCASCHQIAIVPEWKKSVHYTNNAGIVVHCADCHEPHDFVGMLGRKVAAVDEVWNQLLGTISTPEKFEAHRRELAEKEWTRLRAENSQECQDCHNVAEINDPAKSFLAAMHTAALAHGQTCIDCHKGVAHQAPTQSAAAEPETKEANNE